METCGEVVEAIEKHLGTAATAAGRRGAVEIPPEDYQFDRYPEYLKLKQNFELLESTGLGNPFFTVHERVTNDTTVIGGQELINFSSYNYLGMSGDPVVAAAAKDAIDRYGTSVRPAAWSPARSRCTASWSGRSPTSSAPRTRSSSSAGTRPTKPRSATCSARAT